MAIVLRDTCRDVLPIGDFNTLEVMVDSLKRIENVEYVVVQDKMGQVLAHKQYLGSQMGVERRGELYRSSSPWCMVAVFRRFQWAVDA